LNEHKPGEGSGLYRDDGGTLSDAASAREAEHERWREAERRRLIAESLREILAALNSNQPLSSVLDLIAAQARRLLDTQAVGIYRLESEADRWAVEAAQGLLVTYVAGSNVPIGQSTLRQAILSRRPLTGSHTKPVHGLEGASSLATDHRPAPRLRLGWYRAWLAVPLLVKDQVYGGMLLYYTEPRALSEEEIQLATSFCDQAALAIENARLREQVEQAAAAAERERLARDLHDAVTQTLFSASVIAEALPRIWDVKPEEARQGAEELHRLTRGALAEMRTMLVELRPAALVEKPLGELLSYLCDAFTSHSRIPVTLEVEGDMLLPADVQVALYRMAQEALNNVGKHARASGASVVLRSEPGWAQLQIWDDGCGFDPAAVGVNGFGLGTMRERAGSIGAILSIKSQVGQGSHLTVDWQDQGER
jgi:signal transduction histidine kinase